MGFQHGGHYFQWIRPLVLKNVGAPATFAAMFNNRDAIGGDIIEDVGGVHEDRQRCAADSLSEDD